MKYIAAQSQEYCESESIPDWGITSNLVSCAFFFWHLGSPLQKNYVGFLRSLLYQVAEQRRDLIPIMLGQQVSLEHASDDSTESFSIHAWTKERLDTALRRLIRGKPSTIRLHVFADGLDEFDGDEESLIETLRMLSRSSNTHVCVSSRPEQIFRQGFAGAPQLRLQDLNYRDIEKATRHQLVSPL